MTVVNIHQAKTRFSRLVERAEGGEEIVIARAGKPGARLVPLATAGEAAATRNTGPARLEESSWSGASRRR